MPEYGVRATNSVQVVCDWCMQLVLPGEQTAKTFLKYGHTRCYRKMVRWAKRLKQ